MTGVTRIPVDVQNIDQLYATFDPSPFHEFSLNTTAAQYIASQAWYAPRSDLFVVELSLRGKPASKKDAAKVEVVVRQHFTRLAANEQINFRKLLRTGVISLAIGLCVLAFCTALSRVVDNSPLPDGWREGLRDGISVFGWVANWRPAQILFYDWWPLKRNRNLYRRLATADVVPGKVGTKDQPGEEVAPLDTMPIESGQT
ncbi:hypothetical protein [Phreatobacter sp.]|uniref:hypothetical protein n=1 Tax=Phreatobacter sp. TaxID=1966341 RepID=UPI003F7272A6